jgi:intein/homing endonuclease
MYLGKDRITILDEVLGEYLNQFGKSYEKHVPDVIKELSPYDIQVFLNAFRMGDGSIRKGRKWKGGNFKDSVTYTTCSKRLADDLGELTIKIGKSVSYQFNAIKGTEQKFRNGSYFINHDTWTVFELTSQYRYFNKMQIKEIDYDREVYDLEVEKHHTILTRRNGKVVWGSNCRCCLLPVI